MKKLILGIVIAFFAIAATQAQNPVKSTASTAPKFEKEVTDAKISAQPKDAVEKKKDDCSKEDKAKCGSKSSKSCCSHKKGNS
jgi:hypothetical protein